MEFQRVGGMAAETFANVTDCVKTLKLVNSREYFSATWSNDPSKQEDYRPNAEI
jgi:hypothetical protein